VTVFVPSSPTPFTGWTVTVPRGEVRELPITIDQALRYLVSAGVVVPGDAVAGADAPAGQAAVARFQHARTGGKGEAEGPIKTPAP
jgi:uncharacterized membrane protein